MPHSQPNLMYVPIWRAMIMKYQMGKQYLTFSYFISGICLLWRISCSSYWTSLPVYSQPSGGSYSHFYWVCFTWDAWTSVSFSQGSKLGIKVTWVTVWDNGNLPEPILTSLQGTIWGQIHIKISLKITYLKFNSNLSVAKGLKRLDRQWWRE